MFSDITRSTIPCVTVWPPAPFFNRECVVFLKNLIWQRREKYGWVWQNYCVPRFTPSPSLAPFLSFSMSPDTVPSEELLLCVCLVKNGVVDSFWCPSIQLGKKRKVILIYFIVYNRIFLSVINNAIKVIWVTVLGWWWDGLNKSIIWYIILKWS